MERKKLKGSDLKVGYRYIYEHRKNGFLVIKKDLKGTWIIHTNGTRGLFFDHNEIAAYEIPLTSLEKELL